MSTLIKGGRIITAADDYIGDVYIDGERIAMLGGTAAKLLGISRPTLYDLLKQYRLQA